MIFCLLAGNVFIDARLPIKESDHEAGWQFVV
jgi:hypothetical protein